MGSDDMNIVNGASINTQSKGSSVHTQRAGPTQWVYVCGLGDKDTPNAAESDVLSAISFDATGEHLAVGDRGGRVIVFRYSDLKTSRYFDYRYYAEFQSHEPEFDHLKSNEVTERITSLAFLRSSGAESQRLLATNEKVIKLWKVGPKAARQAAPATLQAGELLLPRPQEPAEAVEGRCRKLFQGVHTRPVNSLSVSPDAEHFLSADDCHIHLWNVENNIEAYNVQSILPKEGDSNEVITHMEFHPRRSDMMLFSSSEGYMNLSDLRCASEASKNSIKFKVKDGNTKQKFFSSIVKSITSAKFAPSSENYIFSRDYLTVQIWDVRKNTSCIQTLNVTDYLDQCLLDLYESERIFDRFDLHISPCSTMALTGSYGNHAHVIDLLQRQNTTIGVQYMKKRGQHLGILREYKGRRLTQGLDEAITEVLIQKVLPQIPGVTTGVNMTMDLNQNHMKQSELLKQIGDPRKGLIEHNSKEMIAHTAWHPKENIIALAKRSSLFIYTEWRGAGSHSKKLKDSAQEQSSNNSMPQSSLSASSN